MFQCHFLILFIFDQGSRSYKKNCLFLVAHTIRKVSFHVHTKKLQFHCFFNSTIHARLFLSLPIPVRPVLSRRITSLNRVFRLPRFTVVVFSKHFVLFGLLGVLLPPFRCEISPMNVQFSKP
jgi:hypothetical protein